jgi:hypothetical protein
MIVPEFEKLGVFYLGKNKSDNNLLLYDSKDLVTHAVCVGMTGSGKTGLCITLLEEAAIRKPISRSNSSRLPGRLISKDYENSTQIWIADYIGSNGLGPGRARDS